MVCVPVVGPWVSTGPSRVEFQLACPPRYVVGGLDAELSSRGIDVGFVGALGSPVNPGITTAKEALFLGRHVRGRDLAPSFRPLIGCVPAQGGGRRSPTAYHAFPPTKPTVRQVKTSQGSRRREDAGGRPLPEGQRLVSATHALAFYGSTPPTAATHQGGHREADGRRRRRQAQRPCEALDRGDSDHRATRPTLRTPMTFSHPLMLLTLLVIPAGLVLYRLIVARRRMRYAVRYTNVDVLAAVVATGRPWRRWLATGAFLLALAALCVAVSRPHVHRLVASDNATVILVLDVSGSMQAQDVKPTRLVAAQKALHTFLEKVPPRLKIGFIMFAGEAEVSTPPTTDHELVSAAIDQTDFFRGFGGTAIGDAVALAVQVGLRSVGVQGDSVSALQPTRSLAAYTRTAAKPGKAASTLVSILFLSDGHQTRGILTPLQGAAKARAAGIPVYTVSLGTTGNTTLRGFPAASPDPGAVARRRLRVRAARAGARSEDAEGDRRRHRRQVLPGEVGGSGPGRVSLARLQARPETGHHRGHRSVPRGRRRPPRARRRALLALGAAAALRRRLVGRRETRPSRFGGLAVTPVTR